MINPRGCLRLLKKVLGIEGKDDYLKLSEHNSRYLFSLWEEFLTPKQFFAINLYYGLVAKSLSLERTAKIMKISAQAVRGLHSRALKKLSHPPIAEIIKMFIERRADLIQKILELRKENETLKQEKTMIYSPKIVEEIKETPIEHLGLSVRTYNRLVSRQDILTLQDLADKTKSELMKTVKLGPKALREIELKLLEYGSNFYPEKPRARSQ